MSKKSKPSYSVGKTVGKLIADLKPIAWALFICAVICVCSVLLTVQTPEIINDMTNMLYDYGAKGTTLDMVQMGKWCIQLLVMYGGAAVLSSLMVVLMTNITSRYYTKGMRVRISEKIKKLPVSFVDNTPNGELLSRMMNDVSNMSNTIHVIINTFVDGFVRIVLITILMYQVNWAMATAVVVLVPLSVVLSVYISNKSEKTWHEFRKVNGQMYAFIEEDYGGFDTVKAYNLEEGQREKFVNITNDFRGKMKKGYILSGLIQPIIALTNSIAYVAVCVVGGLLATQPNPTVSVGDIVEIVLFAKMFAGPLESIAGGMGSIQHTLACANRVYKLLEMPELTQQPIVQFGGQGEVEFRDVCFSYSADKPLIQHLNLKVKAGQKVALVGPTGGGKTTIVNLLMRFYDVDSGSILIDGVDISTVDRATIREQFGMVLQDTWLFNGTVFDNIAYGTENATIEQVEQAAKYAYVDHFVNSLPNGYNTVINEESTNISSGQKQLLTIARSYLANRRMLILDEATSNVDTRTEILLQQAMDRLLKGRTSFVIAHRLSTIVNADMILVVNNGQVVEQGTHKELLERNGFYTKIYNSQYELLN